MRKNHTLPRLYWPDDLSSGTDIDLPDAQAHYLGNVLRKRSGDGVRLFNANAGEWRAEITAVSKRKIALTVGERLRSPEPVTNITLLFAPIKKHRMTFILEKATELGATRLQPVITARTQLPRFNTEKARAQVIEAAEQCERLDVPEVRDAAPLLDVLAEWEHVPILFADEAGAENTVAPLSGPVALLVGPEGGFTDRERDVLRAMACVTPVTLGPRILRADTAALFMLARIQAS